jgi:hypothetical protein
MNGEEKKTTPSSLFLILGGAIVLVILIFAIFSSPPSTVQTQKSGLSIKLNENATLKSNTYFNLNFTILNNYDVVLENFRVWTEAGNLFTFTYKLLSNETTLKNYPSILPKTNISYFFGNVKVEKIDVEMKNVPIILKTLYVPKISKNFTINSVNNNSLQLYGGIENMGIRETDSKKIINTPLSVSFSYSSKDFVFREGSKNFASFKIIIGNSGGGKCISDVKLKLQSEQPGNFIVCSYNNMTLVPPIDVLIKPSNKIEIPCNFTLSYLKEKDFVSIKNDIQLTCDYLEEKIFYFNIYP